MPDPWTKAQQEFMLQFADGQNDAARRIKQFGDDYFGITRGLWKLVESYVQAMPGAPPQTLRDGLDLLANVLKEKFERMYLPAFGPIGAPMEAQQRLMATTLRWQRAAAAVSEQLSAIAMDAVDKLQAAIAGPDAAGPPVTSMRALHDLWVECGERAYAAAAHSEDFAAAQAELLSALVEMRFEQRRQIEEWSRAFNLPTRTEIDSIHQRLHALRRRLREDFER